MNLFKKIGIISIVMFSFYYTEKVATLVLENNPLYKEIENKKNEYEIQSIAAIIDDNYIIPGLNGVAVNVKDSYYNMKALNAFNSYYLLYSSTVPTTSLMNNTDKIVKQGNPSKNSIALVLEYDENIINYLKGHNFSVLVDLDTFKNNASYEQINNDINNFTKLENLINKYTTNSNICILNSSNEKICRENKKFLVKAGKVLNDSSVLSLKDNINAGDIILIKKNTKVVNVETILKSIMYKDYEINKISEHISEER